jgi:hypothetical protein
VTQPRFLAVKGFRKFQHYRDRDPVWIKLYTNLLIDAAFLQLPEAAQAQLMKLWILASQLGNPLPNNPKLLAEMARSRSKMLAAPCARPRARAES